MAGETLKTEGIVLDIRPWSRTSHIVTWLTPGEGPVSTPVKGAVRPKSAFLGQYDLFYTCELVYYMRARNELHAIREASPVDTRDYLRGDFRATAFASYAASLMKEHCPHGPEALQWYGFLARTLDGLKGCPVTGPAVVALETGFLGLAGLAPDFAGADLTAQTVPFSVDGGHVGAGAKTVHLPAGAARILAAGGAGGADASQTDVDAALRFLGIFLRYHLETPPDVRRNTLMLLSDRWRAV